MKNLSILRILRSNPPALLVCLAVVGLSFVSFGDEPGSPKGQASAANEAVHSRAAIALSMEAYREIQTVMIEAEFQKRIQNRPAFQDHALASEYVRWAAQRRDLRLKELAKKVGEVQAAYNSWAISEAATPTASAPALDKAAAATHLRTIAASAIASDLDPLKKMVVKSILRPTPAAVRVRPSRPASAVSPGTTSWITTAQTVAGLVQLRSFALALLAVIAVLVGYRMSQQLVPAPARSAR